MQRVQVKKPEKERKISFVAKESTTCPVCDRPFHREELFSGRVNADDMTDELHRTYKPTHAFGDVYPLAYEIIVCPSCFYASFRQDFLPLGTKNAEALRDGIQDRVEKVQRVFSNLDYQGKRGLLEGAASYYLALLCYEGASKEFSPTIKSGLCCLRCAWLCGHLDTKFPGEHWDYLAQILYRKARFYYKNAIKLEESRKEPCSIQRNLGPDTDKNYGYEGVVYMAAILDYKYGPTDNHAMRIASLGQAKINVARMFGLGKKTKAKPGPLLEMSRNLYDRLKAELKAGDDDE